MALARGITERRAKGPGGALRSLPLSSPRPQAAPAEAWVIDPVAAPADPALIARIGAGRCLRLGLLPWRRLGGATVVLAPSPTLLQDHAALLEQAFGPVRHLACDAAAVAAGVQAAAADLLVAEAESRVAAADSCRSLARGYGAGLSLLAAAGLAAVVFLPGLVLAAGVIWAALTLGLSTVLRLAAILASRRRPQGPVPGHPVAVRLPVVSLLVPLLREREVAAHLLARLQALDYPQDRLDICLILEAEDDLTRRALTAARLPANARVIEVPAGTIRTKPRALNYALDFARGTVIGIYDAEDRPAPDQIRRVVGQFARAGPDLACLQGTLDYYNHGSNWLARCFTLEYAAWFRVILPGLARLGLVVPLGGTTLFLRRHAIEEVGGWDAHNVTEDADLGIRLARRGFRTEIIDTVTEEEANARAWPWVRQRTRWLKGYAMTWAVHSRDPARLWRDLGPVRFMALQVLLLGTLSQFLLAPLLWSFWLVPFGLPHPLAPVLPPAALTGLAALFLLAEATNIAAVWIGAARAGKGRLAVWIPALQAYFPLATVAAWRALWQAVRRPFMWEKTAHGIFPAPGAVNAPPEPAAHQVAGG